MLLCCEEEEEGDSCVSAGKNISFFFLLHLRRSVIRCLTCPPLLLQCWQKKLAALIIKGLRIRVKTKHLNFFKGAPLLPSKISRRKVDVDDNARGKKVQFLRHHSGNYFLLCFSAVFPPLRCFVNG